MLICTLCSHITPSLFHSKFPSHPHIISSPHLTPPQEDVRLLDPELYNGLIFIRDQPMPRTAASDATSTTSAFAANSGQTSPVEGETSPVDPVEDLCITFAQTQMCDHATWLHIQSLVGHHPPSCPTDCPGHTLAVDLIPHGHSIPVTSANKHAYIAACIAHLERSLTLTTTAFQHGLFKIIPQTWLRLLSADELSALVSGTGTVDVAEWRANTVYSGVYYDTHPNIVWFWEIVDVSHVFLQFTILFSFSIHHIHLSLLT